ncbi:MAG: BtpA/SgcQ family protein [Propionibacteriaceae bacterium]|jgi:membrane complex biogenesis BtpA family protein|nr:BtpA/SgcQ family protein [Propionibacteriaceae bacterium]
MNDWIQPLFGTTKPVVAMLHLMPLPGDPHYDETAGMAAVIDRAARELDGLQAGGVDAIMFSNEFSLPYLTKTEPLTAIAMARIIGQLKSAIEVPFGVNVLWDGRASIDLAKATDASFVREIFTGVYSSDFGLWNTNIGEVARHRHRIGADHVKLLFNIVPESAQYLSSRSLASITRTTVFATGPDGLCVSGLTAGAPTDLEMLTIAKANAGDTPVFVNTGVKASNAAEQLAVADGAVVGSYFKVDGVFENEVDTARVRELMAAVKAAR